MHLNAKSDKYQPCRGSVEERGCQPFEQQGLNTMQKRLVWSDDEAYLCL